MPHWTEAEINQLLEFAGDMPRQRLLRYYNHWAKCNGYPRRTIKAIYIKAQKQGVSLRAVGSSVTTGGIAKILGISGTTVEGWMHRYPDFPHIKIKRWYYINRDDLRRWARQHMHLFGGIDHANLIQLLEDEQLADAIVENHPTKPQGMEANAKPVQCIDTGKVYPSLSAAARDTHMTYQAIMIAIRQGRPACGLHWRLV